MASILDALVTYGAAWEVAEEIKLNKAEIASIREAKVVPSKFGLSVCLFMKAGGNKFFPLSRDSNANVDDTVDLNEAVILRLTKEGEEDIYRMEV